MKTIVKEKSTSVEAEKFPMLYISRNTGVPVLALSRIDDDTLAGVWFAGYGTNRDSCEGTQYSDRIKIHANKLERFHGKLVLSNG